MGESTEKHPGDWSLAKLSEYNGMSEVENAKIMVKFLMLKAEVYGISQTIRFGVKKEVIR